MRKLITCMLVAFFSISYLSAQDLANGGCQYFKVGDIEAVVMSDGHFEYPSVQPIVAPDADPSEVASYLEKVGRTNTMDLALNILLLKKGDKLILLDSGVGEAMNGRLLKHLKQMGVSPEQITDIVISHAHFDHIAGLFDKDQKIVFKNAKVHISQIEYDFWTSENPDFSRSKAPSKDAKEMIQGVKTLLGLAKPYLTMVQDGTTLYDALTLNVVPGHTPGHMTITVSSAGETLVCISDLVHETMLLANPRWGIAFDFDFGLGINSRIQKLKELYDAKALIFAYHLPYPGVGCLRQLAPDSYEWLPKAFASPYK